MAPKLTFGSQAALAMTMGCLVVTLQADLYDDLLERIREGVLDRIGSLAVHGVVFDLGAVRVLDAYTFNHLADTARMTALLGAKAVFVGFAPGAVSSLVDLDVDTTSLQAFRSLEAGIAHLTAASALPPSRLDEDADSAAQDKEAIQESKARSDG